MNTTQAARRNPQSGVTLVESLIVMVITTVSLGAVAPSFESARARRQLEGVAAQLETDIQHARSTAVAMSVPVRMSFSAATGNSCYVVHTGPAGSCRCDNRGAAVCNPGSRSFQSTYWTADHGVRIESNSASMLFDAARGTVTPTASIKVHGRDAVIQHVVNIMGRVRSCTPAAPLPGYRSC